MTPQTANRKPQIVTCKVGGVQLHHQSKNLRKMASTNRKPWAKTPVILLAVDCHDVGDCCEFWKCCVSCGHHGWCTAVERSRKCQVLLQRHNFKALPGPPHGRGGKKSKI